jgi:hypothetical protein
MSELWIIKMMMGAIIEDVVERMFERHLGLIQN